MRPHKSAQHVDLIIELHKKGTKLKDISKVTGLHWCTCRQILRVNGITFSRKVKKEREIEKQFNASRLLQSQVPFSTWLEYRSGPLPSGFNSGEVSTTTRTTPKVRSAV